MRPIEHLYRGARLEPLAAALEFADERLTHGDLVRRVDAFAAALQRLDPRPRSRVAIAAHNTPEHVIAILATLAAGKVWVALNPLNGKPELDAFIAATRPSIVVADADCLDRFQAGEARVVVGRRADGHARDGDADMADLVARHDAEAPAAHALAMTDLQAIKFTGGSTGRPKGVMQSVRSWNTVVASHLLTLGFGPRSAHLCAAPVTHGNGTYLLPALGRGGRIVLLARPKAADILDAFERRAITSTFLPPTAIYNLLASPGVAARRFPRLAHLVYAGAPMRPAAIVAARRVFGPVLETSFGQTEAPQIVTFQGAAEFADARNHESAGRATPLTRLAIMDKDGRLLGPDAEGEIVVRGDIVMNGYLDQPEETAKTIVDGWLHTGDLGAIAPDGRLFIRGRLKDVIISGGFNIYPADVEAAIGRHEAVEDCVAFGVEDEKWGERLEVAVELKPGRAATAEEIKAAARAALGPVKTPKAVHLVERLPRSAVGKVLRREAKAAIHPGK